MNSQENTPFPLSGQPIELKSERFYVTTPIYYPNAVPHIGHAYTTIIADVLNRYHALFGKETYFITGTDEHGQKVQEAAEARGMSPQEHVDDISARFSEVWEEFSVKPDLFMRTTFDFHKSYVQQCLQELFDRGDIYRGEHTGWYSVSEEIFWPEIDIVDGKSPTGKEVTKITEENYFFRMSNYTDELIKYIENNPGFISPPQKESETLGFLRQEVTDLCIGRPKSRVSWGIELPFDSDFVSYVWFDALLNYVSAIDEGKVAGSEKVQKFWPETLHLIGKDILITHTVYWPTMLMALKLSLPKTIFAHGWWLNADGKKMSKSEGDVVAPLNMKEVFGVDAFRYYMTRGLRFGNDLAFDIEKAKGRVNDELANNYGNLISRSVKLSAKTFDGKTPPATCSMESTKVLAASALSVASKVYEKLEAIDIEGAVGEVVSFLDETNKYFGDHKPWALVKEGKLGEAGEVLYSALEAVRIASILLSPVMPDTTKEVLSFLSPDTSEVKIEDALKWGLISDGTTLDANLEPVFQRIQ